MQRLRFAVVFLLLLLPLCGCAWSDATPADSANSTSEGGAQLTKVTLQLNWFPEVEHGGYYAALVHGFYREAGLDVTILPGGPDTPVLQQVARKRATFGVINADNVLFGRAQQVPAVALMAPLQNSPRCLIVHESSGIRSFEELKDLTIAMLPSAAFAQFLRSKLPLTGVKVVPYSGSVAPFLLDPHYAQQGYVFSEPFIAKKQGGDPHVLMVSQLGFNPYTSLVFTHDDRVREEADLVGRMVAASIRGWGKYIDAPDQTNAYIHKINPEMDLDILAYGAKAIVPLVLDPVSEREGIGTMSRERWQTLADQLVDSGQLKGEQAFVDEAFTTKFLEPPSNSNDDKSP
jgi:NitT/TauT family transport system substrate-binding protein